MIPTVQLELPLRFFRRIQCSAAQVDDPDHHLRRKPSGLYQLRITIGRGPKLVGQRKVFGLDTRDTEEARKRRDVILKVLKEAGHVIRLD